MPLAKLSTLQGGLPKLYRAPANDPTSPLALPQYDVNSRNPTPEEKYAVYPPFASTEEVYIWSFIHPIDPFWTTQVSYGDQRIAGSTRVDFQNDYRRISLFADGNYFHNKVTAKDAMKRAALAGRGLRVLVFSYNDLQDAMDRFPDWYRQNIG